MDFFCIALDCLPNKNSAREIILKKNCPNGIFVLTSNSIKHRVNPLQISAYNNRLFAKLGL